jgi:competence protein ComGC
MKKATLSNLVIISVVVVLSLGILLPYFFAEVQRTHDWDYKRCQGHLKKLGIALSMYKLDYNTYPQALSDLYPGYVKWECTSGNGSSNTESLNINVENKRENCFMCPGQTSFTREPENVDSWTTYIYKKPPDKLKEDFMVLHCLGYPHFRQRCELWLNKKDEFEIKMSKYNQASKPKTRVTD